MNKGMDSKFTLKLLKAMTKNSYTEMAKVMGISRSYLYMLESEYSAYYKKYVSKFIDYQVELLEHKKQELLLIKNNINESCLAKMEEENGRINKNQNR